MVERLLRSLAVSGRLGREVVSPPPPRAIGVEESVVLIKAAATAVLGSREVGVSRPALLSTGSELLAECVAE